MIAYESHLNLSLQAVLELVNLKRTTKKSSRVLIFISDYVYNKSTYIIFFCRRVLQYLKSHELVTVLLVSLSSRQVSGSK